MKLISNKILVDVGDHSDRALLLNTLTGIINVLDKEEVKQLLAWDKETDIQVSTDNKNFFNELLLQKYIVENDEEEQNFEKEIMASCRENYNKWVNHKSDVTFVLTYQCNFACPYCYEEAFDYNKSKILTEDMVDKIFELQGSSIKYISLYGGEPLQPETMNIIKYIIHKAPDATYGVTTNGYYLDIFADIFKPLKMGFIMVTLDGAEAVHNKTRKLKNGEGTYQQIIKGISKCLEVGIHIKIRMNVSKINVDSILKLREHLIKMFKDEYENGLLAFEMQPLFQLNPKDKSELNDKILYERESKNEYTSKDNMMSYTVSPILDVFVKPHKRKFIPKYCHCTAESRTIFYDSEGDIYTCILSLKNKMASIGTYYPEYKLKQSGIHTRNVETIEQCSHCKMKFLCGGGCANEIIDEAGNVNKPNCRAALREVYYELPKLFKKYSES